MGEVKVDDPIVRYLPEVKCSEGQKIAMFHLLTHTSGLPGWLPTYIHGNSRDELIKYVLSLRPEYEIGRKVVYSCMGFIILGLALERILGYDFSGFLREDIFEKLQMKDTGFYSVEECKSPERLAPTGERSERLWSWLTKNNLFLNKHIDGKVAFGSVNDENAIALGGISGNAGLFSTAADLSRFAIMYLNGGLYQEEQVLNPTSIKLATINYTEGKGDNRGLGWLLKGTKNCFGTIISDGAYGHTGFTGTGLWIDPVHELVIILLTNRVHMMKNAEEIHNIRPQFVNAVVSSIIKI